MIGTTYRRQTRRVLVWRYEELVRAGYTEREAMILSDQAEVDLHRAIELVRRGCPPKTAARILLP